MMRSALIQFRFYRRLFTVAGMFCLLASTAKNACGQEALRISTAGDLAAESRKQSQSSIGYYNLLLGPTAWRFSSGLGLEYNDNVHLQHNDPESDFIFRPNLNVQVHWPVTEKNSLDVSLGVGYSKYLQHQELNQFYINPGSGIAFNVYAGDWMFNLHERISITENAYQSPGVNGNGNNARLENTMGASASWDLNKALVTFGYDHVNYVALTTVPGQPDATSEIIFVNGGLRILPEILVGLEAGVAMINYGQSGASAIPDAMQWNAGAFCSAQISEYISTRLDAGYTVFSPDATSTNFNAGDITGYYFQFSVSHRVNQFVNYSLSAGRSTDFSNYGQPYSRYSARLQPNWNIFRKYQLSTPLWWEQGKQLYNQAVKYDQYGIGIDINRSITKKLSGGLSYQFVKETSTQSSLNYTVNIVGLNFSYQF